MNHKLIGPNYGGDAFSSSLLNYCFEPEDPLERLVTLPLLPEEFSSRLRDAMKVQLPTSGAVMDLDGVVHMIVGHFTWCDRKWATIHSRTSHAREGWFGWGIFEEKDINCLECIGDAGE